MTILLLNNTYINNIIYFVDYTGFKGTCTISRKKYDLILKDIIY